MSAIQRTTLFLTTTLVVLCLDCPCVARADEPVAARGKGFEIRRAKLDEAWTIYQARVERGGQLPDEPRAVVEAKLLNHIVETEILLQKATAEEKQQAQAAADHIMTDSRKHFPTDDDFRNWLRTRGMTPEQYHTRMFEQHASEQVIDRELKPSIHVSDDAVKKYYEDNAAAFDRPDQFRARQIWFATVNPATQEPLSAEKKQEKEKLAREVKKRIDRGEDFLKLYQEFSDEPWAKTETHGDEPLYVRGQMPPEFDAAAFSLKPQQVSDVITSRLGFHIIRVSEFQPASRLPLPEVATRLKDFLVNEEIKKRLPDYLEKLRKDAAVEIVGAKPATAPVGTDQATVLK